MTGLIFFTHISMSEEAEKTDLTEVLEDAMRQPKKAQVDDQIIEQHSLSDLIAMDKYIAQKKAQSLGRSGIKFAKMLAGGSR